jgi:hypothetical protein
VMVFESLHLLSFFFWALEVSSVSVGAFEGAVREAASWSIFCSVPSVVAVSWHIPNLRESSDLNRSRRSPESRAACLGLVLAETLVARAKKSPQIILIGHSPLGISARRSSA